MDQNPLQFNTIIMMQVEGESLQPRTLLWRTTGTYSTEYIAGLIGLGYYIVIRKFADEGEDYSLNYPV